MTQKITKRDKLNALIALLNGEAVEIATSDLVDFCTNEIALLDKKAAKAKETAAKKKAESDELTDTIAALLTDEAQTIADITAQIDDEDVTVHKVSYRLTQLAKAEKAERTEISIPGKDGQKARKVVAYALATAEDAE